AQNALPCAERLIKLHALAEAHDAFWQVFAEAEDWLKEPARFHDAGQFFNKALECGDLASFQADRSELRDRCRLGLAGQLPNYAKTDSSPGTPVAALSGPSRGWAPPVVPEGEFAVRAAVKRRTRDEPRPSRGMTFLRARNDTVTAAVVAPDTGDLFLGFRGGAVVHFDSWTGEFREVREDVGRRAIGLATDSTGVAGGGPPATGAHAPARGFLPADNCPAGAR